MHIWQNKGQLDSRGYVCGYCANPLASNEGYLAQFPDGRRAGYIYICHFCGGPTYFDQTGKKTPGTLFGADVKDISDKMVECLYNEARRTMSTSSYTAAVLCCRKLLMHVAVSKGAQEADSFVNYVKYLADHHFVPPDAEEWVDQIREKGNEANHEIVIMDKTIAENLISFIEMLLKVIYEFPAAAKRGRKKPQGA